MGMGMILPLNKTPVAFNICSLNIGLSNINNGQIAGLKQKHNVITVHSDNNIFKFFNKYLINSIHPNTVTNEDKEMYEMIKQFNIDNYIDTIEIKKQTILKNIIEANMYIDNLWSEIMIDITKFDTLQIIKLRHKFGLIIQTKLNAYNTLKTIVEDKEKLNISLFTIKKNRLLEKCQRVNICDINCEGIHNDIKELNMIDNSFCCMICYDTDDGIVLLCGHFYHRNCISEWFNKQKTLNCIFMCEQ